MSQKISHDDIFSFCLKGCEGISACWTTALPVGCWVVSFPVGMRVLKLRFWILELDAGCWMLDSRFKMYPEGHKEHQEFTKDTKDTQLGTQDALSRPIAFLAF